MTEKDFRIIIDTREQAPLPIPSAATVTRGLKTGDYSVEGYETEFAIERKSLQDLVQSLTRERPRFEREMQRLAAFRLKCVLVEAPFSEAQGPYRFSAANPKSILASVGAFWARYGIPFVFASGRGEAARWVVLLAWYFVREREREKARAAKSPETARTAPYSPPKAGNDRK